MFQKPPLVACIGLVLLAAGFGLGIYALNVPLLELPFVGESPLTDYNKLISSFIRWTCVGGLVLTVLGFLFSWRRFLILIAGLAAGLLLAAGLELYRELEEILGMEKEGMAEQSIKPSQVLTADKIRSGGPLLATSFLLLLVGASLCPGGCKRAAAPAPLN
jgi:hypothetical protein